MKILAIESSCDETAVAIVQDGRQILSSVVYSQIEEHQKYGGVVPEIASRKHIETIVAITDTALKDANLSLDELDAIAVTTYPGLIGALLVGVNFAKGIAFSKNKPLIAVHHIKGHIAANYIAFPQLKPPFLCLVVSGGHTHIIEVLDYTTFNIIGKTRDDAVGEAFDKTARTMGFPYPGGIHVDKAAAKGDASKYKLPKPKVDTPYDFSFSGLKTAVINLVHNAKQKEQELDIDSLCASFQKTVCEIICDKLFAAAQHLDYKTVVVAGGVCANSGLREMLHHYANQRDITLFIPPIALCGDNAAMIGAQAFFEYQQNNLAELNLNAQASKSIQNV